MTWNHTAVNSVETDRVEKRSLASISAALFSVKLRHKGGRNSSDSLYMSKAR